MRRLAPFPLLALVAALLALAVPADAATGLDPTYGDAGVATFLRADPLFPGELEPAGAFWGAMDPDGRALLSDFDDSVVRLTPDGARDVAFGYEGTVAVPDAVGHGPIDATGEGIAVAGSEGPRRRGVAPRARRDARRRLR